MLSEFVKHVEQVAPPDLLYHYTTQAGLIGIVEKGELWATKVQYMNDATEFGLASDIARERIRIRTGEPRKRLEEASSNLGAIANVNIFVACFCEQGDLLGQWRGYSGGREGFSIGFHTSRLGAIDKRFKLGPCIYDPDVQRKIIDELLDFVAKQDADQAGVALETSLLGIGAFFKDKSFAEEREWRLASQPVDIREDQVGFRPGLSMPTPFYKLPLGPDLRPVIEDVTVGPCPHPDLSVSAVEALLIQSGIRKNAMWGTGFEVNVRNSSVPYRHW